MCGRWKVWKRRGTSDRKEKKETERGGGRESEDSHLYAMLMDRWRDETS